MFFVEKLMVFSLIEDVLHLLQKRKSHYLVQNKLQRRISVLTNVTYGRSLLEATLQSRAKPSFIRSLIYSETTESIAELVRCGSVNLPQYLLQHESLFYKWFPQLHNGLRWETKAALKTQWSIEAERSAPMWYGVNIKHVFVLPFKRTVVWSCHEVGNWFLSGSFETYKFVFKLNLEFNTGIVLCLVTADALYNKGTTPSVNTVCFAISTPFSGQVREVRFRTHLGSTLCSLHYP
jgi:hypothetical protein